jgi:hypothetical protein
MSIWKNKIVKSVYWAYITTSHYISNIGALQSPFKLLLRRKLSMTHTSLTISKYIFNTKQWYSQMNIWSNSNFVLQCPWSYMLWNHQGNSFQHTIPRVREHWHFDTPQKQAPQMIFNLHAVELTQPQRNILSEEEMLSHGLMAFNNQYLHQSATAFLQSRPIH